MRQFIKEVGRGKEGARDLSFEDALEAARLIADGSSSPAQTAAFLMAVRVKGEAPSEIAAFAQVLGERCERISPPEEMLATLLDCAGPHDGRKGFAATLPVAVLCASAGLPSVLHASPTLPPKSGASLEDILKAAGHQSAATPAELRDELLGRALAYCPAEALCPPLAQLRRLREEIGVRTLINTAEKLINPAGARRLLVGVNHASAMQRLGSMPLAPGLEKLVVVQGLDGSEDLPVHKASTALVLAKGKRKRTLAMDPFSLGLGGEGRRDYAPLEQAGLIERILSGEEHPSLRDERHLVLYNTAFRLWIFGGRASMNEGLQEAFDLLKSGKSLTRWLRWLRQRGEVAQAA